MRVFVIGGTSGLGEAIAKQYIAQGHEVLLGGRTDRKLAGAQFVEVSIEPLLYNFEKLTQRIVKRVGHIDILVYAVGEYQEGTITDISLADIEKMLFTQIVAPALYVRQILNLQQYLDGFIAITSTSQFTPREKEPIYTAAKAGLGMLANSLSLDDRIGKTLVAAPGGMATRFYEKSGRSTEGFLDPNTVARQIVATFASEFKYRQVQIPRNTGVLKVMETRAKDHTMDQPAEFFRNLFSALTMFDIVSGIYHPAEGILAGALTSYPEQAPLWIHEFYYANRTDRPDIAGNMLRCLGRVDRALSFAVGMPLAEDALKQPDVDLRDNATIALEFWESPEALVLLKNHLPNETVPWLRQMIQQIIEGFEKRLSGA